MLRAVFAETGTDRRRADQDGRNPNYSTRELHIRSTRRVDQVDQAIRTLSTSLRPSGEGPGKPDPHPHLHNGGRGGRPKLISPHSRTSKELRYSRREVRCILRPKTESHIRAGKVQPTMPTGRRTCGRFYHGPVSTSGTLQLWDSSR